MVKESLHILPQEPARFHCLNAKNVEWSQRAKHTWQLHSRTWFPPNAFIIIHSFINRLRSIARRFIFLPIYPSLLAMGYHLLASSIRFPIISLASELVERARSWDEQRANKDYEEPQTTTAESETCLEIRFRIHPSLFVCASLRQGHPSSVVYYAPLCPSLSRPMRTHKTDYGLDAKK